MPLPVPQGRQREVVYLPAKGHVVVLGTAGSGKTTMAVHRAAILGDTTTEHSGPTILITFNRTLISYLRYISSGSPPNVTIENYHKFARGYLNSLGQMPQHAIANARIRRVLITRAVARTRAGHEPNPLLERLTDFYVDEFAWLVGQGIDTLEQYTAVQRIGRIEARVPRSQRGTIWDIYQEYLRLRGACGYLYDWDDLASAVLLHINGDCRPRRYKHVVVDEGQDLSPQMLRSLSKAVPDDGSLTFFGDMAQQIYGHRMSWRPAGLQRPKIWHFKDNYRNTRQIAALGLAISEMPYYVGAADMVAPVTPTADGPKPTLVRCGSEDDEARFICNQAEEAATFRSVAILVRRRAGENMLRLYLPSSSVRLHKDMGRWPPGPGVRYGTYHSAKGVEFDQVFLPFLSADRMPSADDLAAFGRADAEAKDGRLLYVGVTRARSGLVISYTGESSTLLPPNGDLYTAVEQ